MTQFLGVISGKGGVGKTTFALNLGVSLSGMGRHVIVVDGNLNTPNIGVYIGEPNPRPALGDVLNGDEPIENALYLHPSGITVVPNSASFRKKGSHESNSLANAVYELNQKAELVIIDSASGVGNDARSVIEASDAVVVVTTPDLPSVTDALRAVSLATEMGKPVLGAVVNKVKKDHLDMSVKNIEAMLGVEVIGTIPYDENMRESVVMRHPLVYSHPESSASLAFCTVARFLVTGDKPEPDKDIFEQKNKGLLGTFFG